MASTLMDAALTNGADKKQLSIIQMFTQVSPVFSEMPMTKIDGRAYDYEREAALPAIHWRAVNQAWPESTGRTTPFREHLKIIGGEVKVDRFIQKTTPAGARDEIRKQIKMKTRAAANEFDRAFLEGSELTNPNEMVGLRSRITGNQLVANFASAGTPAGLKLSKLDLALDSVPFPDKVMYMSRSVRRHLNEALNDPGSSTGARRIVEDRNRFGMQVERYGDTQIRIVEQTGDGSTILGYDEDPGDGGADTSSIYIVAFGDELCHGIYNNGGGADRLIDVEEFGVLESEPRYMVRFEGYYGQVLEHPRCVARLYGIADLAGAA